jgi:hypothetical protein
MNNRQTAENYFPFHYQLLHARQWPHELCTRWKEKKASHKILRLLSECGESALQVQWSLQC